MYLKDCIISFWRTSSASLEKIHRPFAVETDDEIIGLNELGLRQSSLTKSNPFLFDYTGTSISDRDYRLAIARARALNQNPKSE